MIPETDVCWTHRPKDCECDDTHERNETCCMPCWRAGFRRVPIAGRREIPTELPHVCALDRGDCEAMGCSPAAAPVPGKERDPRACCWHPECEGLSDGECERLPAGVEWRYEVHGSPLPGKLIDERTAQEYSLQSVNPDMGDDGNPLA